jgi:hypothetical protein
VSFLEGSWEQREEKVEVRESCERKKVKAGLDRYFLFVVYIGCAGFCYSGKVHFVMSMTFHLILFKSLIMNYKLQKLQSHSNERPKLIKNPFY